MIEQTRTAPVARKPKIAILGEFSSGKSTLANALLGRLSSPVRVTATQVPPICYTYGTGDPVVVDIEGGETEIAPEDIASVPVEGTEHVRVHLPAEILIDMDFLDMPGSSDPNMSLDVWHGLLPQADAVIWCTPATQAWRQSEAAIWDEVEPEVQDRSVLLVTRIDKVLSDSDRARLMKRLRRETTGCFRDIFAVDLLSASEDFDVTRTEGISPSAQALHAVLKTLRKALGGPEAEEAEVAPDAASQAAQVLRLQDHASSASAAASRSHASVMPRRISSGGLTAMRRPRRTSGAEGSAV